MKDLLKYIGVAVVSVGIFFVGQGTELQNNLAGARPGDECFATSTAASSAYGATITGDQTIITGSGTLCGVTITGATTGHWTLYNATTTDVNKRTGNKATSTILIADFADTVEGDYKFETTFSDGLLLELDSGSVSTSTIGFRR